MYLNWLNNCRRFSANQNLLEYDAIADAICVYYKVVYNIWRNLQLKEIMLLLITWVYVISTIW